MRHRRYLFIVLALAAAVTVGALLLTFRDQVPDYLRDDSTEVILYSIDGPSYFQQEGELTPEQAKGEILGGYPVLGKVAVTNAEERRLLTSAVEEAMRNNTEPQAKCFIPRHALRLVRAGDTIDLLICFQCHNYIAFRNNKPFQPHTRGISSTARNVLDELLVNAGVPLAAVQ